MKKILILGSSGQIGFHLKEYLGEKNYKVFNFDIVEGKSNDLRKKNNLKLIKLLKKSDYVFFLAFDVGGSRYLKKYQNSKNFIMNNMMIMSNTFDLLSKYKKPFLFASSQMSNMLYSNYGLLKLIGERITSTLNGNFVKLWNVYGIENDINKSHVITDFVLKAIKFKKIQMLTNGKESREFLYADDCCEALEIIMKKHNFFKNKKTELHLTNGIKTKIVDIAKIIKKNLSNKNLKIKIISGKSKDNVQLNKNNKNNNFLKKYWKPKVSISAGVNKIISHYSED